MYSADPTVFIPLTFVVLIDAVVQIIEDISRHRADMKANASIAHLYDPTSNLFVESTWALLAVGDIIKIFSRESVPADVVIISVAEKTVSPQGICYVETKSLDGVS